MTLTNNLEFSSTVAEPTTTIFIDPLDSQEINLTADIGDKITPGLGVYPTKTTQPNDVTPCTAGYGKTSQKNSVYGVDIEGYSPDYPSEHYHVPNDDITARTPAEDITTYSKDANRPLKGRKLKKGMKLWGLMSLDASGAATHDEILIHGTDGFYERVGDPDGETITIKSFGYRVLATIATQNWVPLEVVESITYDATP